MRSYWINAANLLVAVALLTVQPTPASESSSSAADATIRALADQTARQLTHGELDAVYTSMSPKAKIAYSHNELVEPISNIKKTFGRIESYDFKAVTYGKRKVGHEWMRTVTYWYHAKTEKNSDNVYIQVEVTTEEGRFYVAGYSVVQVVSGGAPPFLKK